MFSRVGRRRNGREATRALPRLSQQMSRLVIAGEASDRGAGVLRGIGAGEPGGKGEESVQGRWRRSLMGGTRSVHHGVNLCWFKCEVRCWFTGSKQTFPTWSGTLLNHLGWAEYMYI